jgi:hypothetical protein
MMSAMPHVLGMNRYRRLCQPRKLARSFLAGAGSLDSAADLNELAAFATGEIQSCSHENPD